MWQARCVLQLTSRAAIAYAARPVAGQNRESTPQCQARKESPPSSPPCLALSTTSPTSPLLHAARTVEIRPLRPPHPLARRDLHAVLHQEEASAHRRPPNRQRSRPLTSLRPRAKHMRLRPARLGPRDHPHRTTLPLPRPSNRLQPPQRRRHNDLPLLLPAPAKPTTPAPPLSAPTCVSRAS
jgi:hypothetical protein